jgi:hypothetical protein
MPIPIDLSSTSTANKKLIRGQLLAQPATYGGTTQPSSPELLSNWYNEATGQYFIRLNNAWVEIVGASTEGYSSVPALIAATVWDLPFNVGGAYVRLFSTSGPFTARVRLYHPTYYPYGVGMHTTVRNSTPAIVKASTYDNASTLFTVASNVDLLVGMYVVGTGIPAGAKIANKVGSTQFNIDKPCDTSGISVNVSYLTPLTIVSEPGVTLNYATSLNNNILMPGENRSLLCTAQDVWDIIQ